MQILETLSDGRQLLRVAHPFATSIAPGQMIADGALRLPLLRHDATQGTVDIVVYDATALTTANWRVVGDILAPPPASNTLRFITHDDAIFTALHALMMWPRELRKQCTVISVFTAALPFRPGPSRLFAPHFPSHAIAALPLLEDWGVFNRIVHPNSPGCYDGELTDLLAQLAPVDCEYVLPSIA